MCEEEELGESQEEVRLLNAHVRVSVRLLNSTTKK